MKILVIDDDPAMTDILKIILSSTTAVVYSANTGTEGLRILREIVPAIVILDLMMPEMDGWQVTNQIRSISSVPILILSVINNPEMVARALDAGADDYLIKPATSGILIAHINNLTRRNNPDNKQTAPLHIDFENTTLP
ncbi:MAG: response regulator transcription factor [Chloroflexi bacterium]|nr:response regulator transcription factor [Chloroflexota bacterium]